jgi:hypothetical protein
MSNVLTTRSADRFSLGLQSGWQRGALALAAALSLVAVGCSDTDGTNKDGTGTDKPEQICSNGFCVEANIRISAEPSPVTFADQLPGTTQKQTVTIRHVGTNGTLRVSAATFADMADQFSVVNFQPIALEAGKTAQLEVEYKPTVGGAKTVDLDLTTNSTIPSDKKFEVKVQVVATGADLLIQPNPIDFGNVPAKTVPKKIVSLTNNGTTALELSNVSLQPSGSPDFTISQEADLTAPIGLGAKVEVELTYNPTGGDADESVLLIEAKDGRKFQAKVKGNEIAPRIQFLPPKLTFGEIELNKEYTKPLRVCNVGLADLQVDSLTPFLPQAGFVITVEGEFPKVIAPPTTTGGCETGYTVTVKIKAELPLPKGSTAGALQAASNDPAAPTAVVKIDAETNAPKLKVTPEDFIDFAFIGQGVTIKRTVELFNEGSSDIIVSKLSIVDDSLGEFKIVTGNFNPTTVPPTDGILGPGKYASFEVQVTAKGPVNQQAKAKLIISSNDLEKPEWELPMVGERKQGAECKITLLPPTVNFGLLPYGTQKILTLGMKNTGSGVCEFQSVKVTDCPSGGIPPLVTPPTCNTSGSVKFQAYAPSANLFKLQPGDTGKVQMAFTAPEDLGLFGEPNSVTPFYGLVVTEFKDQATGVAANYPNVKIYDPTQVKAAKPNLEAKVGKAQVTVLPGNLDFTITTVGCKTPPLEVGVYNTGTTEVFVNKLELQGCGVEVQPDSWPGIPKTGLPVSQAKPSIFKVKYAPQNAGKDQCQLAIWTSLSGVCTSAAGAQSGTPCNVNGECSNGDFCAGQLFTVPIKGEGTFDTDFTDEFVQGIGKKVDVLFVVDDSGSMGEEQSNLSKNFAKFVQTADIWNNDYHIGVVSTDMDDGAKSGKLQSSGATRIVTPATPGGTSTLQALANLGTNGSGTEQGLAAAEAAVTAPLTTDLGKACNSDSDCSNPAKCIPDADDPAKKGCGGTNRTFLRKNAGLEVVILSDEEDGSAADINYYTNFFYSVKGLANKNLFHLHAIVGPKPNGCQSSGGDAVSGDRYIAVANNTGGIVASICDQNFATALQNIGTVAFGLAQQFFLTRTPEPDTIEVKVNGTICPAGAPNWEFDAASNSVTFLQGSACMPEEGDKVSIYYKMLCYP